MPRTTITWQARGEYLAGCIGVSPQQFAAGIDSAMAGNRQGLATRPASGERAGAGTKTKRKARATTQAAGAAQ
jgi:hypothetical protein